MTTSRFLVAIMSYKNILSLWSMWSVFITKVVAVWHTRALESFFLLLIQKNKVRDVYNRNREGKNLLVRHRGTPNRTVGVEPRRMLKPPVTKVAKKFEVRHTWDLLYLLEPWRMHSYALIWHLRVLDWPYGNLRIGTHTSPPTWMRRVGRRSRGSLWDFSNLHGSILGGRYACWTSLRILQLPGHTKFLSMLGCLRANRFRENGP